MDRRLSLSLARRIAAPRARFARLLVEAFEFAFDDGTAARGLGPCGAVERGGATALVLPVWVETLVQGA